MSNDTPTPTTPTTAPRGSDPGLAAAADRVATVFNVFAGLSAIGAVLVGLFLAAETEEWLPALTAVVYGALLWATFSFYSIIAQYIKHRVR